MEVGASQLRFLLIFPRFRYPSGDPPLGVAYLAAVLAQAGHEVDIFDATFERRPLEALERTLKQRAYDAIGISMLTSMLTDAAAVARVCREHSRAPIFLGGPHPTVDPAGALAIDGVDAVMIGEGERSIVQLAAAGGEYTAVPGMAYVRDGDVVLTGEPQLVQDLDDVPFPARGLLDMEQYMGLWYQLDAVRYGLRGTSMLASRGCPFDCAYCQPTLRSIFGKRVRRRSPENIVAELVELKREYNPDGVMWLDDTFLLNKPWTIKLCDMMIEADLGIIWGCNIRVDLADHDVIEHMKRAGLRIVHVGIETASQRILDEVYHKGITVEQVRRTVAITHEMGLSVRGYFMLGAPGETEAELLETVKLANELPLDDVTFSITTPLPHTHLYEETRHLIAREFSEFDYYKCPVYAEGAVVDARRLDRIRRMAYIRFYLGPRRFWRTVRSVLGVSGIKKMLLKLQRF